MLINKHMLLYSNFGYSWHQNLCASVPSHKYAIGLLDKPTKNVDTALAVRPEELLILVPQIVPVVRGPSR